MINTVTLNGNMTRDPQVFNPGTEKAVAKFSIAQNRMVKGEQAVSFFDCTAFRGTADAIGKYFQKGKPIIIQGYLQQETWVDESNNEKRSKMVIIVTDFAFASSKDDDSSEVPQASETIKKKSPKF